METVMCYPGTTSCYFGTKEDALKHDFVEITVEEYEGLASTANMWDLENKKVIPDPTYEERMAAMAEEAEKNRIAVAKQLEVLELKDKLRNTDYITAKIAEGAATREEYADVIAQRAAWRARINELEN